MTRQLYTLGDKLYTLGDKPYTLGDKPKISYCRTRVYKTILAINSYK